MPKISMSIWMHSLWMTRTVSKRYTHTLTLTQHCDCDVSQRIFPTVMSSIVNNNIRWCLRVYRVNPPCNASRNRYSSAIAVRTNRQRQNVWFVLVFFWKILRNSWLNRLLQIYCVTDVTEHLSVNLSPFLKIAHHISSTCARAPNDRSTPELLPRTSAKHQLLVLLLHVLIWCIRNSVLVFVAVRLHSHRLLVNVLS